MLDTAVRSSHSSVCSDNVTSPHPAPTAQRSLLISTSCGFPHISVDFDHVGHREQRINIHIPLPNYSTRVSEEDNLSPAHTAKIPGLPLTTRRQLTHLSEIPPCSSLMRTHLLRDLRDVFSSLHLPGPRFYLHADEEKRAASLFIFALDCFLEAGSVSAVKIVFALWSLKVLLHTKQ